MDKPKTWRNNVKKYKVRITFIMTVFFTIASLYNFTADAVEYNDDEVKLKHICAEVENQELNSCELSELLSSGLSTEEAEYYVRVGKIVDKLEENHIKICLEDYEYISDEDFRVNRDYYRKRILKGDKAAIGKAMETLNNLFKGKEYIEKLVDVFPDKNHYEIVYPDGTMVKYFSRLKNMDENSYYEPCLSEIYNYRETLIDGGVAPKSKNIEARECEWSFMSGISYSKIYLYSEFLMDGDTSTIIYARGGQASYGVVNIANSTGAVITRNNSANGRPAEARNEVIFNVTGAFGGNFMGLSLSVTPGANWTQYIIFRIYDSEECDQMYGAPYTWHGAVYR